MRIKESNVLVIHRIQFALAVLLLAFLLAPISASTEGIRVQETKSEPQSTFATLDGVKIHYVNYGEGSAALVLIHGWTQNIDAWRDQIPELARRNRVIAVDLPGHGKSDKPETKFSMEYFAQAVEAVMREAGVTRAVLVGHSMGTPVARQFYRKYPDKTIGIVIVDGLLRPLADAAAMKQMLDGLRGPNYKEAIAQMFTAMIGPNIDPAVKDRINAATNNTPQHVLVSAMEGMADPTIWGDDKINVPTLAIMAKNPFFPPNLEELMRGLVPNLEYHMWSDVTHFLMMEKPKEFNATVVAFLDKNKLLKK